MYVPVCLGCAGCDPLDHQGCTVERHIRGRPNFVVNYEMVPVMTLILSVDTHNNKGVQVVLGVSGSNSCIVLTEGRRISSMRELGTSVFSRDNG